MDQHNSSKKCKAEQHALVELLPSTGRRRFIVGAGSVLGASLLVTRSAKASSGFDASFSGEDGELSTTCGETTINFEGRLSYVVDGSSIEVTDFRFEGLVSGGQDIGTSTLTQSGTIDGSIASGTYQVDGDVLYSDGSNNEVQISITLGGYIDGAEITSLRIDLNGTAACDGAGSFSGSLECAEFQPEPW